MTMRRWLAATVISLAGCTWIGGLNQSFDEVDCFPAGTCADASVEADATNDSTTPADVADVVQQDMTTTPDAPVDAREAAPADAPADTVVDAPEEPEEAGCVSGAKQCAALVPQTCVNGAWQSGAACPYVCTVGACSGECVPTTTQCDGQQPQTCDATGTWQDNGAPCPNVCSAGQCAGACSPTTTQCSGLQPQTCTSGGTWQNTGSACPYVCAGGACSGMCVPTTTQCSSNTPQTCSATGQWVSGTACGVETCSSGACICESPAMTCGGVCAACSTPANATAVCSGTTCSFTCNTSYTQCGTSTCADLQTDSNNCGGCGHACGTGSTCSSGACTPITVCAEAAGSGSNTNMVMARPNGGTLYWDLSAGDCIGINGCTWSILSCPAGGTGATPATVTSGGGYTAGGTWPNNVNTFDYELIPKPTALGSGGLYRYTSTSTTRLTSKTPSWVTDFTTGHVFYPDGTTATQLDEILPEVPTDAGFPEERPCEATGVTTLADYAAGAGYVYVVDSSDNEVLRYTDTPATSGTCGSGTVVASGLSTESIIVADTNGTDFYFADANGIHVCASAGTGCHTIATGQGSVSQLTYDATNLYWIGSPGLMECAKAGCNSAPLVLAPNLATADNMDVDPSGPNIYYLVGLTIYRLAK